MKTLREYIDILRELEAGAAQPAPAGKATQPAPAGKATQPAPAGKATQPAAAGAAQPAAAGAAGKAAGAISGSDEEESVDQRLRKILGQNYENFVKLLGKNVTDTKFIEAIESLHTTDKIDLKPMNIKCTDLTPMQKEIDVDKSLTYPLTDAATAAAYLAGGPVTVGSGPIVTAGGGKYIIDGHHRWSQVYVLNPHCHIVCSDISDIDNPFNALKSAQLGIVSHTKKAPEGEDVGSLDLMTISQVNLSNVIKEKITDGVLKVLSTHKAIEVQVQQGQVNQPGQSAQQQPAQQQPAQQQPAQQQPAQQQPAQQQPAGEGVISGSDEEDLKDKAANYMWQNVQSMRENNKNKEISLPSRILMPQTSKQSLAASPGDDNWSLKQPGVRAEAEVRTDKRGVIIKTLREYIDIIVR